LHGTGAIKGLQTDAVLVDKRGKVEAPRLPIGQDVGSRSQEPQGGSAGDEPDLIELDLIGSRFSILTCYDIGLKKLLGSSTDELYEEIPSEVARPEIDKSKRA